MGRGSMGTQEELQGALDVTRAQLAEINEKVERNTDMLHKSQRREMSLLQAQDLSSLFREMTLGLASSYQLQSVSVVLADPDHDIRHLLTAEGSSSEEVSGLILVETLIGLAPQL